MAHQRQVIREKVAALLSGATGAGARVFQSRVVPYRRLELPAIAVYARSEQVDPESRLTAPRELTRSLQLAVEIAERLSEDVDDALDALALQVEKVFDADPTLGGEAGDSLLGSTQIDLVEDGDKPIGVAILTYEITYRTDAPDADDVSLDDLVTVSTQTSLGGVQAEADRTGDVVDDLDEEA